MKIYYQIILTIITSIILGRSDAQTNDSLILRDSILMQIKSDLPENWEIYIDEATLIITRNTKALGILKKKEVEINEVHHHVNSAPPLRETMKRNIVITFSEVAPRLSSDEYNRIIIHNDSIESLIKVLPGKFKHRKERGKGPNPYIVFDNDSVRQAFELAEKELKDKKLYSPIYYSEKYSYKWRITPWMHQDYIWKPEGIENEVQEIIELLNRALANYEN